MFDFVISGNQRKRPSKRILVSCMLSCLAHGVALFLLIEYPELLRGPGRWDFANLWHHRQKDEQNWRLVTIIDDHFKPGPMILPSAATLKKMLSDSEKKGPGTNPPIRLNDAKAVRFNPPVKPKSPVEIAAVPPSSPPNANASPDPVSAKPETGSPGLSTGNPTSIKPPLSEPEPKPEVVANVAPNKIPDTIKTYPSTPSVAAKNPIVSEEGKKTSVIIPSSDDSRGFPMGDYSSRIAELLKEKYLIPSYLKESGHTTIHFYIEKDGRTMNIQILTGSGSKTMDMAALSAVQSCNLPALPKGFPRDRFGVQVDFSYNEHP